MGSFHSRDESLVFELPPEFQKLSIIRLMRGCTACTVAFAAGPEPWFVRFQCEASRHISLRAIGGMQRAAIRGDFTNMCEVGDRRLSSSSPLKKLELVSVHLSAVGCSFRYTFKILCPDSHGKRSCTSSTSY